MSLRRIPDKTPLLNGTEGGYFIKETKKRFSASHNMLRYVTQRSLRTQNTTRILTHTTLKV